MPRISKALLRRQAALRRRREGESGQSTVEFALSLTFMIGFVLFFLQLCFLIAYGNFVHYATFMAARAYLSSGDDPADQKERAKAVVIRLLKRSQGESGAEKYGFIARGEGGESGIPGLFLGPGDQFAPKDSKLSWMEGVRYKFRSRLTLVPLGAKTLSDSEDANLVTLTSESWLGREKTVRECRSAMPEGGILDNGC